MSDVEIMVNTRPKQKVRHYFRSTQRRSRRRIVQLSLAIPALVLCQTAGLVASVLATPLSLFLLLRLGILLGAHMTIWPNG